MTFGITAGQALGVGASIFGGLFASQGSKSAAQTQAAAAERAAETQAKAAREALALQEKMYERQIGLQEPYRQAGLAGQNRLMELLGLRMPASSGMAGASPMAGPTGAVGAPALRSESDIRNALLRQYTTGGGQVEYGREGGMQEAPLVVDEASLAAAIQDVQGKEQAALNVYRTQQAQAQQAQQAQQTQTAPSADFGKYARDFGMQDFQQDPGYAFRLAEGQKALDRQAAARGGLISGGALKAATRYGQEMGSQEYQNAFNRYQTSRANQLQPLGNLMASGQSAASNMGSAAGQYGAAGANLLTGAGQAIGAGQYGAGQSIAAGQLGVGNTINNALGTIGSAYQTNQLLNRFYPVGGNYSSGQIASANAMNVPQYAQPLYL